MTMQPGVPRPKRSVLPAIAIGCFVVGAVLVGFFVWRIVVTAPRAPQPIESGRVELKDEGLTIYSSVPVLAPPCKAQDADGNDVPLKHPTGSETITINGDSWYVVARSVDTVPAGVYSISCTDDESSATYAAGPKSSIVSFVLSILGTIFSFLIFVGLGVVFLIIWLVRKSRRNRLPTNFPPQPGAPGNYPQSNYPPPPNQTFPQPPPYNPGPNPDRPQDRRQ
jgi:cell division septation protein DedD